MKPFIVGKTYQSRSIGDSNCVFTAQIVKRTPKTVTAIVDREQKNFRVDVYEGVEFFRPFGNYSMAPIIRADKEVQ